MPQATTQTRWQVTDSVSWVKGAHTLRFGGEASHTYGRFDLGVFRDGRIEMVQDFPQFDLNGDGGVNDDDLLFAVTLRSGKPDQNLVLDDCSSSYIVGFRPGRLARHAPAHAQPRPALRGRHQRQEHLGLRRHQPDRRSPSCRATASATSTTSGRASASSGRTAARAFQLHGGYGLYYDRVTLEIMSLERGLDGRALPIEVRAGNVFFLDPATGTRAAVRADASRIPSPASSCPARARPGSTSSTTRSRTRRCSSSTSARASSCRRTRCCSSTSCTTAARTSSSGGRSARSTTRSWAAPTAS